MFRYPDVSATQIAFVYAGDIWTVPKKGGTATQLARAIQEVMQRIGTLPAAPARPPYEKRVPRGGK